MKWNEKTVHAIVYNRETQQRVREILSPKEIIDNPLGKETDVIIMACAKVLSELVGMKEAEAERINNLMHTLKKIEPAPANQIEMPLEN